MRKYLIVILASALVLLFSYVYQTESVSDRHMHIIFCDVGQGDGIYIRTIGKVDIVIDGGQKNGKMAECLARHMPFYDKKIELMFATHPDADHIGGLVEVLKSYQVDEFASSTDKNLNNTRIFESLKAEVAKQKIPFKTIVAGDRYTLSDGTVLTTFWPQPRFESTETNEYSLVQVLKYKEFAALITGDITYQILNTLDLPSSYQVFKIPHHGSKTGIDEATLQKIKTYFVPISLGANNRYHHPHPSVLALLQKYKIPYKRTDQVGSIEVITDGINTKLIKD